MVGFDSKRSGDGAGRIMHLSIDDISQALEELSGPENHFESVFEEPVFGFLKTLHDTYGAVFSLYCFFESKNGEFSLRDVPDGYKEEFAANHDWLRFGFHSKRTDVRYDRESIRPEGDPKTEHIQPEGDPKEKYVRPNGDPRTEYEAAVSELIRITGGEASIDRIPRIHFYAGTREACRAFRDAAYGVKGFLASEDERLNYYLNEKENQMLHRKNFYYDPDEHLCFFRTNIRLEQTKDILEALKEKQKEMKSDTLLIFTHEHYLRDEKIRKKMELCCQFAADENYRFAFPMDL